jgi:hypothetical protein
VIALVEYVKTLKAPATASAAVAQENR